MARRPNRLLNLTAIADMAGVNYSKFMRTIFGYTPTRLSKQEADAIAQACDATAQEAMRLKETANRKAHGGTDE